MPSVTFSKSGKTLAWDDTCDNLLDFAETHGVAIAAGCRCGSDTVCMTRLLTGKVVYNSDPLSDPDEGSVLPCICKPATDITLEA